MYVGLDDLQRFILKNNNKKKKFLLYLTPQGYINMPYYDGGTSCTSEERCSLYICREILCRPKAGISHALQLKYTGKNSKEISYNLQSLFLWEHKNTLEFKSCSWPRGHQVAEGLVSGICFSFDATQSAWSETRKKN